MGQQRGGCMIAEQDKRFGLFSKILEWLSLGAVIHYCIFLYFETTRFLFSYDDTFRTITFSAVVILGLLRLITGLWKESRTETDEKASKQILLKGLLAVLFSIPCIYLAQTFSYIPFVYLPFIAFCLYDTEINQVLKLFYVCIASLLAVTILCALSGSIRNLIYQGLGGMLRASYGIIYPTDCAAFFVYLFLFAWIVQRQKGRIHTVLMMCLALVIAYGLYAYLNSRNSVICMLLTAAVVLYDRLHDTVLCRTKAAKKAAGVVDALTVLAFPLSAILVVVMTWLYGSGSELGSRLDVILSERLTNVWASFQKYGIQAMGALTPQSGWGGIPIKTTEYEFLDSSYALLLIRYGWVLTLIVAFLWMWMTRKAIRTGHRKLALAMGIIALHSMTEHHFPDLQYNILLAIPLCSFARAGQKAEKPEESKKAIGGWIAGIAVFTGLIFLLPQMITWARYILMRKGWTGGGENSFIAMLCWLLILLVVVIIWVLFRRILNEAITKKKVCRKALAGLIAVICLITAGGFWASGKIDKAVLRYSNQIKADEAAIQLITEHAEEPVYTGQAEGILYQRSFRGISDWMLSPDELARTKRGTILLDHDIEAHQLINAGAKYIELSSYTGVYTFDHVLAERMSKAGYQADNFYSAERRENLAAFTERNEVVLNEDGTLKLGPGRDRSLKFGSYLEQYSGNYEVTFILQLTEPELRTKDPKLEICSVRASTLWGKGMRVQETVCAKDFDENGQSHITLRYSVEDTRGVEYLVFCKDEMELILKQISWKQIQPDNL